MSNGDLFSDREGIAPEKVGEGEAPPEFRNFVLAQLFCHWTPAFVGEIREALSRALVIVIEGYYLLEECILEDTQGFLLRCEWYEFFDCLEEIIRSVSDVDTAELQYSINRGFKRYGIGWRVEGGRFVRRSSDAASRSIHGALGAAQQAGWTTCHDELRAADESWSKRPNPDLTGVIQHANLALEVAAKEASGTQNTHLRGILQAHPNLFPPDIGESLKDLWKYICKHGHHINQGVTPTEEEAEFVLLLATAVVVYLERKTKKP